MGNVRDKIEPGDGAVVLGLALAWLCVLPYPYRPIVDALVAAGDVQSALVVNGALPVFTGLAFAAALLGASGTAGSGTRLAAASGTCGTVGYAACLAATMVPQEYSAVFAAVGTCLVAAYIACACVAWGCFVARRGSASRVATTVAVALAVGDALLVALFFSVAARTAVYVVAPVASMALLCRAGARAVPDEGARGESAEPVYSRERGCLGAGAKVMLATSALFVYFNTFFVQLLQSISESEPGVGRAVTALVSAVLMLLIAVVCLRGADGPHVVTVGYLLVLAVYLAALLVILLTFRSDYGLSMRLWTAAGITFKGFAFLALVCAVGEVECDARRAFGLYGLFFVAVPFVLSLGPAGGVIARLAASMPVETVVSIGEIALFAAASASIAMFAVRLSRAVPVVPCPSAAETPAAVPSDDERVAKLLADAGLTEREIEIVALTRRGYSAKAMAEKLSLSEHTVNNHAAKVYRKLGMHSRQELLAYLDEACG